MKKLIKGLLPALCSMALLFSCSEKPSPKELNALEDPSLGITTYEIDQLKGKTTIDQHSLQYAVVDNKGNYYIELLIDGHHLEAWINYNPEILIHDGHNAVLSQEQKELLLSFSNQLGEALVNSNGNSSTDFEMGWMEYAFLRTVEFWSQAPTGFVHDYRTQLATVAKSTGNDGVTCIKRGSSYTLSYTDRNNRVIRKSRTAGYNGGGSYSCMGRCGAACGSWWAASAWTLDCFEHDQCSLDYGASGGGNDPNCGDEWWEASDDWIYGVSRGCSG